MCSGGGGTTVQKSDPTPVAVTSANTGADHAEAIAKKKERNKARTQISADRGTLLGGSGDTSEAVSRVVSTLGGVK